MSQNDWKLDTKLIHPRLSESDKKGCPSHVPISLSAGFAYETAEELEAVFKGRQYGHIYSRISNPTVTAVEQRLAFIESARAAALFSSGLAAITAVVFALCDSGDSVLVSRSLFGGTFDLFEETLKKANIKALYIDPTDPETAKNQMNESVRFVFLETIGNPKMDFADIAGYVNWAHSVNIPVVLDNTTLTPYGLSAKDHGIDLVISSTTKYLTGAGTCVGGLVADTNTVGWKGFHLPALAPYIKQFSDLGVMAAVKRHGLHNMGASLSPMTAFLIDIGLETLAIRMKRHSDNALALADFLVKNQAVTSVAYLGHPSHAHHQRAKDCCRDGIYGGLLTCDLSSERIAKDTINALKLVRNVANFGESKTLVIHPASTIFLDRDPEAAKLAGAGPGTIRIAVGLEHPDDIINDFEQALYVVTKGEKS